MRASIASLLHSMSIEVLSRTIPESRLDKSKFCGRLPGHEVINKDNEVAGLCELRCVPFWCDAYSACTRMARKVSVVQVSMTEAK